MTDQFTDIWLALSDLAAPLGERLASAEALEYLFYRYGWDVALDDPTFGRLGGALGLVAPLEQLLATADALRQKRAAAPDAGLDMQDIAALAQAVGALIEALAALRSLSLADLAAPLGDAQFWQNIGEQLLDDLLEEYLRIYRPPLYLVLRLWGVIRYEAVAADAPFRLPFTRTLFDWDQLLAVLRNPPAALKQAYAWGDPVVPFRYEQLFDALRAVLSVLHLSNYSVAPALQVAQALPSDSRYRIQSDLAALRVALLEGVALHDRVLYELGLQLFPASTAAETRPSGLLLSPIARGGATGELPLAGGLALRWNVAASADALLGLILLPGTIDLIQGPLAVGASLELAGTRTEPWYLVGSARTARIELRNPTLRLSIEGTVDAPEARFAVQARTPDGQPGGKVVIPLDAADSFVKDTVAQTGLTIAFAPELTWSSRTGLTFNGRPALDITLPVDLAIGPVRVQQLLVRLAPRDTGGSAATLEVSANLAMTLGPMNASVERMGFELTFDFSSPTKNIGVADVDFGFKPPSGAGLTIDAPGVSGGGFLLFDEAQGQYAGVVQIAIEDSLTVKGVGLIGTRLPGGAPGYSLLVIITAEDFQPIPLPLGFKLTGIGGLLALNRTFDEDVLRAGLKTHALDSILFPRDPVRNAPQLLSNLNRIFPAARGHHLFGPLVQIAWGTPTLVTADLALVLEFGARLRLLILAQIMAILPTRDNDLLRLQMDAVGVIDFDQGTAALDATLYDSRLLKKFVLTGDMALRLAWKGARNFALAVGGLHPAFNPPANFPKLDRIAIDLSSGDNPRIRCEAYFALTANTEQFGARAELYAAAAGFSIHGEIGYDVLLQVNPFAFVADFYAQLQLKHGSTNLFKVKVEGELAGPRPLHIKAKATFEILWWDVSINIDKTLAQGQQPPQLAPVDVLPQLKAALSNPGNWQAQLPAGQRPMVTLRANAGGASGVALHPLGSLTVKQNVVPLGLEIAHFGQTTPAGARLFAITSASLGDQGQAGGPVKDFFAPAQFLELSDDEKLARPSFESMTAGVSFGSSDFAFTDDSEDWLEVPAIEFETLIIDKQANTSRPSGISDVYRLGVEQLAYQARFGAAGASELRHTGAARYRTTVGKYQVVKEGWNVITTADLAVQPLPGIAPGAPASYSEAAQALHKLEQADPARFGALKILRLSDIAG